jgi:hypothetical protein
MGSGVAPARIRLQLRRFGAYRYFALLCSVDLEGF